MCGVAMLVPDCGPKPVNGVGVVAAGVAAGDHIDAGGDDVGLQRLVLRGPDELKAAIDVADVLGDLRIEGELRLHQRPGWRS